jgi:hypothetical protein
MPKLMTVGATALFACVLCATPLSFHLSRSGNVTLSTDTASAVIGRPLTPMSVAGVHRRAERRAYRRGYYGYGAYNNPYRYSGYGYGAYRPYGYTYGAYQQPYNYTGYGYAASRPWSGYGYAYQPWFGSGSSAYPYQTPWWAR